MSEKLKSTFNHEHSANGVEQHESQHKRVEVDKLSILEKAEQEHRARQEEQEALDDAHDFAKSSIDQKQDAHSRATSPAERRHGAPSKKQLEKSFKAQMRSVQSEMDPTSKLFSKIIHLAPIEKVSNAVSATLARPNAMLSGSIAAFISITVLYFTARYFGYRLSGFETIVAFAAGWILGIIFDYLSQIFKHRSKN